MIVQCPGLPPSKPDWPSNYSFLMDMKKSLNYTKPTV